MRRFGLCVVGMAGMLLGCAGSGGETNAPPVKPAPPLQPGVVSLDPSSHGAESSGKPAAATLPPQAPDTYRVKFETTKGDFVVEVHREWAPLGADRFHELVLAEFYDDVKFFRAITGFMVQFGISGDPAVTSKWEHTQIPDDPVIKSNQRGFITFATSGPNSRTTQVFINFASNANLDGMGFAPFGEIVEGMDVVDALNQEYGGEPSSYQQQIRQQGNAFLEQAYPRLDAVKTARIVPEEPADAASPAE